MQFLEWSHHIEGLDRMKGFREQEKHDAKEALLYLQNLLGDDFLQRCCAGDSCIGRHSLLQVLGNFAPNSRTEIVRFACQLHLLEASQNFQEVVRRLHDVQQFEHDRLLIKVASRLVSEGLQARFEPTIDDKNQKQPDLRLVDPISGETLFLEVARQTASQEERDGADANSAVFAAAFAVSYDLSLCGRWYANPSKEALKEIVQRTASGARHALNEKTIAIVEEQNLLEMAICHKAAQASLLESWSSARGLSGCGFLGPMRTRNDAVRIKRKIKNEQGQLPIGYPNVLVVQATDVFFGAGDVRTIINDVAERAFQYRHINLVILHGEYIGQREAPCRRRIGEHRFTRRVVAGRCENDLILFNQFSTKKLSNSVLAKFDRFF